MGWASYTHLYISDVYNAQHIDANLHITRSHKASERIYDAHLNVYHVDKGLPQ